jgi:hypothetical protein
MATLEHISEIGVGMCSITAAAAFVAVAASGP